MSRTLRSKSNLRDGSIGYYGGWKGKYSRCQRSRVKSSDLKKDFKSELREWDVIYDLDEDITSWLSNPPKKSKGNYGILYDYDRNFKKEITI